MPGPEPGTLARSILDGVVPRPPAQAFDPGEIMQLPPDDEIVPMVGWLATDRPKKARDFEDRRFASRVLRPPESEKTGKPIREK